MIKPSVGRVLWLQLPGPDMTPPNFTALTSGPFSAQVVHVHDDTRVNVIVYDSVGRGFAIENVQLVQPGEVYPLEPYVEWMPYQVATAPKEAPAFDRQAGSPPIACICGPNVGCSTPCDRDEFATGRIA